MICSKLGSVLRPLSGYSRESVQKNSLEYGVGASRVLCAMSIFAFVVFAAVDPYMIEGSTRPLLHVRILSVAGTVLLLGMTWTSVGRSRGTLIGLLVSIWTGVGVVVLTQMTGGADSSYWPMVMLIFFTVALMLPMTPLQATVTFGTTAVFFDAWLISNGATGSLSAWTASNAGIWFSLVVSVIAVGFLARVKRREEEDRTMLFSLNEQLRSESAERMRTQEALQRSRQLDAVGQLAAGMAHELNNVLMVISGSAEAIKRESVDSRRDAERIIDSANRGARLTSDILLFAREGAREDKPFMMQLVVRGVGEIIERSHRGRVQLKVNQMAEECWVSGDAQLMSQVLMNLCLNGIDSMNGAGVLTLELKLHSDEDSPTSESIVCVEIQDEGHGMTSEVLARAFEPFFTTKPPGEGTGLGLSMAYGTVKAHGGRIELDTVSGSGTRAIICLPRIQRPGLHPVEADPVLLVNRLSERTILVVDDDDMVRPVMVQLLESLGVRVEAVDGGSAALTKFKEADRPFDLVILDMKMVGMDGQETFRSIRELCPDLPVLIYSGFAQNGSVAEMLQTGNCQFLRKPIPVTTLSRALSSLLEADEQSH